MNIIEFFYALDRSLETVDTFYNTKYTELSRRLHLLQDKYGKTVTDKHDLDNDQVEDVTTALIELQNQYKKLKWYGELNRRGFVKITKKVNKKIPSSASQTRYLTNHVDPKPFATNIILLEDTQSINDWLERLSNYDHQDDASPLHSSHSSSKKKAARSVYNNNNNSVLDAILKEDNADRFEKTLVDMKMEDSNTTDISFRLYLLQRSISVRATKCIKSIISKLDTLDDVDDISKRNCIHRLVISMGRARRRKTQNGREFKKEIYEITNPVENIMSPIIEEGDIEGLSMDDDDVAIKLLEHVLKCMKPQQQSALMSKDIHGRLPIHYAASYGLKIMTELLIKSMQEWKLIDLGPTFNTSSWKDSEGFSPLYLSVLGGHYLTSKIILNAGMQPEQAVHPRASELCDILILAVNSNYAKIVQLLGHIGVRADRQDKKGQTPLHIAASLGHKACLMALLEDNNISLEIQEYIYGWTPLFSACIEGHMDCVELLLSSGADSDKKDVSGWTPLEHAALRGFLDVATILTRVKVNTARPTTSEGVQTNLSNRPIYSRTNTATLLKAKDINNSDDLKPVRSFGHRYLKDESMILVSLGSMDNRKSLAAVILDQLPQLENEHSHLITSLSLVVSANGATGQSMTIDLPIKENISTSPITFMTKDMTKVKIMFDIVPTYSTKDRQILARGVAILDTIKTAMGSKRNTLHADLSVPVVAATTLDVIGSVNFNFLVITPFSHPNMIVSEEQTYWKRTSTMVIGHRGLGKNMTAFKSLQLGENTIPSFIAASNLGASYVEFDVQLTKDHVPVIYHDFLVSETGIDAPVHTLTLDQFLAANDSLSPHPSRAPSPTPFDGLRKQRPQRSYSLDGTTEHLRIDMSNKMRNTRTWKEKGFKANSRGHSIQAPFATLEDMFRQLPSTVGFNIEMKYPLPLESEQEDMDTYAVELNSFVDAVLTKVYDLGQGRNIIFSSFHPDICLLLSFKQPSIPVLFLTESGTCPMGDIRASSLQEAIRFASKWNLLGIVSAAAPLVLCPRLIRIVRQSGLLCFSYGVLNNDPANVEKQAKEGIDAVIVDNVIAVRKGLVGSEEQQKSVLKQHE